MNLLSSRVCVYRTTLFRLMFLCCFAVLVSGSLTAQSTYGTILGVVRDSSGALVVGAQVSLLNTGTTATRNTVTDTNGNYLFQNIDVGTYKVTVSSPNFQNELLPAVSLTARETRRIDALLKLKGETQTVTVTDENVMPVTNTEVSNLAQTKIGDELAELPVAIYSRSTGSTSPISTLTTEAGVQTDDAGNLAVMGTTAALMSMTIDGISSVGVEYSGPVNEMFPSFNSIEEIRVSESNNNAEFSGVADITTISKAGTIHYHGGVFENHENTVFNAGNPLADSKPKIIMNDFGGTLGGPLHLRPLFNPEHPGFFFISYEGLRLPRETPLTLSVPSLDMRNGNLTNYLSGMAIYRPDGVTAIDPAHVPVNPVSAKLMQYLMPLPNMGDTSSYTYNYKTNFASPISSNQGDIRLDKTISEKQSLFARFSYKNRQILTAPSSDCIYAYCGEAGSPLQGAYNTPEIDEGLSFAHNYVFTPQLLNEFRAGFNAQHTSETQNYSTTDLLTKTGLLDAIPQPNTIYSEAPQVMITGFMSTGAGNPGTQRGQIVQALDNLTWSKGKHNFKFGADFKRISDHDDNVYGNYRSGWFVFNSSSSIGKAIGDPFTSFLLGYPDATQVSSTNNPNMDGLGYSYAFYAQNDWRITSNLTLNAGLRYEIHPPIRETHSNTAAFIPGWAGVGSDGATHVTGAVVVSDMKAMAVVSDDFAGAIAPTPILTSAQAEIPSSLRYTDFTNFGPRIGFAWRPRSNDKTVIRGGWGRFIESPLGFSLVAGWAVHSSYLAYYYQDYEPDGVTPLLSFSNPQNPFNTAAGNASGTAGFFYAFPTHYKNPTVQQWNMTLEQDIGHSIGLRLSYSGSHGQGLDAMVDLNQVHPNTQGYSTVADTRPYPYWSVIQSVSNAAESNYNSAVIEVSRHSGRNLTFDSSYTWTRDLSNAGGATPTAFAVAGGEYMTDVFHPGLDYGNVMYDRKHRFLSTWLYDLPLGRNQRWLSSGSVLNQIVGNWQLGGVAILQSGPFLTPFEQTVDPANTNILNTVGQTRPDQIAGSSVYAQHRTTSQWFKMTANANGDNPVFPYLSLQDANNIGIGRFGNAPVGGVAGPGTANFSFSMMKNITLTERLKLQFNAEAANVLNHRNYQPPNMQVDSSGFGQITALQTAEGSGPRSLELSGHIVF